jgi:hypothetical protein
LNLHPERFGLGVISGARAVLCRACLSIALEREDIGCPHARVELMRLLNRDLRPAATPSGAVVTRHLMVDCQDGSQVVFVPDPAKPETCAGCGQQHTLFVHRNGLTRCTGCDFKSLRAGAPSLQAQ